MATTAPKKEVKSSVSFTSREENGVTIINRNDGKESKDIATVRDGKLVYPDKDTKKHYHSQAVRYLNDENIAFDADNVRIEGDGEDEAEPSEKPPRKTIEQGDKTPAYVEWLKRTKPKQFEQQYGVRGPGVVTKTRKETDPATGRPKEITYKENALISDRKTHLTEKADAADQADDESAE